MPRIARIKDENAIYHIMIRSISEVNLFRDDEDKIAYINIVNEYKKLYLFKVYGYCIMTNHAHFIIDCCGADISKIMHSINFKYARYFNNKHKRHGHLFQDRFKSKIVKDERYLCALSLYIHNNPTDIKKYKNSPQKYRFSSLYIYLGSKKDEFNLVDDKFILSIFSKNLRKARNKYKNIVCTCIGKAINDIDIIDEITEYRSQRYIIKRGYSVDNIIEFICKSFNVSKNSMYLKNVKDMVYIKSMLVVFMRSICGMKCSDICKVLGNITQSRVSKLSSIGINLIMSDEKYDLIFQKFIKEDLKVS
ncbi:transposase [Clostridium hydrogeniformans]|uniref:transposase n=1 Tax=Clostridium hydrogeniformans TaxID=349933 RepID=UPI000554E6CA|nr:transposase [Clostridium hydrogeniformans]